MSRQSWTPRSRKLERDPKPSLAGIAKAAGVSRPTLYAHFPTREDLVEAAVKRALDEAQREIADVGIDVGPASEALQRLITTGWRSLARHLAIARLALDITVLYALLHAAADDVTSGRLHRHSAATLIRGSALSAFRPQHRTRTTTT